MDPQTLTAAVPDVTTIEAAAAAVALIIARQLFEMAAKAIPDSATGWRAGLRRGFKALALYIPNKE